MKNSFADTVENKASFQFNCDDSLDQIEDFKRRVNELEGIDDKSRNEMLNALDELKPLVVKQLAWKYCKND